ncbi:hypothetical protein, partial [Escherichia coli]|uniref:hypothetical protein n=1 Tax=Escherichia coli TaxID=562 RepID=UPI001BAF5FFA
MDSTTLYVVLGVSIVVFILINIALIYGFKKANPYVDNFMSVCIFNKYYHWSIRLLIPMVFFIL